MKERNRRAGVGLGGDKCVTIYRTSGQTRLAAAQDGGKVFHKSAAWNLAGGGVGGSEKHGSGMASAGYAAGHFTSLPSLCSKCSETGERQAESQGHNYGHD